MYCIQISVRSYARLTKPALWDLIRPLLSPPKKAGKKFRRYGRNRQCHFCTGIEPVSSGDSCRMPFQFANTATAQYRVLSLQIVEGQQSTHSNYTIASAGRLRCR